MSWVIYDGRQFRRSEGCSRCGKDWGMSDKWGGSGVSNGVVGWEDCGRCGISGDQISFPSCAGWFFSFLVRFSFRCSISSILLISFSISGPGFINCFKMGGASSGYFRCVLDWSGSNKGWGSWNSRADRESVACNSET